MLLPRLRCSSSYQVNFTKILLTMSATKPAELTLAIQKATEGFTVIMDRPTDNNLIEIRQLLVPVLMKTTYDELTLQHNLAGVTLPTERYEQIYKKGAYAISPVIPI